MSEKAMALAADIARMIGRSDASHADKFDALVAVMAAVGVPPEHHLELAKQIIAGERIE